MLPASTKEQASGVSGLPASSGPGPTYGLPLRELRGVICRSVRRACVDSFGGHLEAIVLTGSLARDEATYERIANSHRILGDAEFLLVFQKHENPPQAAELSDLRRRIEEELLRRLVTCKVDLSAVRANYFQGLPAHIFSYELKHCGYIIWGDADVLRAIPEFSTADLSREDAARLLSNRFVEVLECAPELFSGQNAKTPAVQYKLLKMCLDAGTSLLVFLGRYAPTYRERSEILSRLAFAAVDEIGLPFNLKSFAALVAECTNWKVNPPESRGAAPILTWPEVALLAHALWRWEMIQLTRAPETSTDADLFRAWNRSQSWKTRMLGWARIARSSGWRARRRHCLRWLKLCRVAGPRLAVYQAAFGVLFDSSAPSGAHSPHGKARDVYSLRNLLPVTEVAPSAIASGDRLTLAQEILLNYREFLIATRL